MRESAGVSLRNAVGQAASRRQGNGEDFVVLGVAVRYRLDDEVDSALISRGIRLKVLVGCGKNNSAGKLDVVSDRGESGSFVVLSGYCNIEGDVLGSGGIKPDGKRIVLRARQYLGRIICEADGSGRGWGRAGDGELVGCVCGDFPSGQTGRAAKREGDNPAAGAAWVGGNGEGGFGVCAVLWNNQWRGRYGDVVGISGIEIRGNVNCVCRRHGAGEHQTERDAIALGNGVGIARYKRDGVAMGGNAEFVDEVGCHEAIGKISRGLQSDRKVLGVLGNTVLHKRDLKVGRLLMPMLGGILVGAAGVKDNGGSMGDITGVVKGCPSIVNRARSSIKGDVLRCVGI